MQTQKGSKKLRFGSVAEREALIARALRAYWMVANRQGESVDQPSRNGPTLEERGDKAYVVLRNTNRTLAVYRVRTDGMLKRLRRWPKDIE